MTAWVSSSAARVGLCLLAAVALAGCGSSNNGSAAAAPTAQTSGGVVQGVSAGSMSEFLGIPYAAPPVGSLRWEPPQPVASHTGTFDATHVGSACPQAPGPFSATESQSEDCLYLNVYRPADPSPAGGGYPVMVWIHGGALVTGSGAAYNPERLVQQGVVVVTINYRLGFLGFLAHPALSATSKSGFSGDYGLMDQQAALEWVQANIKNFDGDPGNVTIFGESAGGLSVLSQLVNPSAKGLFDKAIVESGSYLPNQPTLAQAESTGVSFAGDAGCSSTTDPTCLRALTVDQILAAQAKVASTAAGVVPNLRPDIFPTTISAALSAGSFDHVPVIEGNNADEYRLFVGLPLAEGAPPLQAANYTAAIQTTLGVTAAEAQQIAAEYPSGNYASPDLALSAVGTDAIFACNGLAQVDALAKAVPTYAYEFADENAPPTPGLPVPEGFAYGAAHAFELQYLFSLTPGANETPDFTSAQAALASQMMDYWTTFAKTGNPNPSSGALPSWTQNDGSAAGQYLKLAPPSAAATTAFAVEHHCAFWAGLSAP